MARDKHRKSKPKKTDHSQRMNRLKAKALAQVADQAWASHQRYKTVALLSEAVSRDPKNPELLISLAAAHGKQRFYAEAEELLARVLELCRVRPASIDASAKPTSRSIGPSGPLSAIGVRWS